MAEELTCPECGHKGLMKASAAAPNHFRCVECGRRFPRHAGQPAPAVLSRSLVPDADPHGIRKPRSILRENLLFFAVAIPLVLLAGGIIWLIIGWVESTRKK